MSSIIGQREIILPTLHPGQVSAYMMRKRFKVIRCGRRWGKTDLLKTVAGSQASKGRAVGWFTPDYKIQSEAYSEILEILHPIVRSASKIDGVIRTITGGRIDFWTLNNPRAGRSRKYHTALLDEVAFAGSDMLDIWEKSIKPALLDYGGNAIAASTPNGDDPDNFFWKLCNDQRLGFGEYHAPTHTNPYLPEIEIAKLQDENAPLVYSQEYLANFVDWKGAAFFGIDSLLIEGQPAEPTIGPDAVFAVVDTAIKDGKEHDGTAVTYFAVSKHHGIKLCILDWDIVQIKGDLLENWMPNVYRRCEELAAQYKARGGSIGAFIEDKQTGTILIQQAERRGLPGRAVDSKLTAAGKDARAISVSGYVHQGMVKISRHAYDKVINFKGITRNHFISQVCGFRIGIKDQMDDLFDTFCYGISLALGDSAGY
jgi:phage terminase large subunit-like protein